MKFRHLPVQSLEDVTSDLEQLQPELTSTGTKVAALETKVAAVEAKVAAVETKLADSGWVAVTFENSWKNTAGFVTAAYRKQGNVVKLRGTIETGVSGKTAFTLPEGFRPTALQEFPAVGSAVSAASIQIAANGKVTPFGTPAISFSGLTFTND